MKFSFAIPPRFRKYSKLVRWIGYPLLYVFGFLLFCYISFPYERLKQRMVSGYNASQTGPDAGRMEIDSLSWSWRFPGITAEGLRILGPEPVAETPAVPPTADAAEGAEASAARKITVDDVYVRVAPLSYLFGTTAVTFGGDAFGGGLSGSYEESTDALEIELELEEVEPSQVPELEKTVGLPLGGVMNLSVQIRLPEGKASEAEGHIDLRIDDLTVGDGKSKIRGQLALPQISAGTLVLKASVTEGQVTVEEFSTDGDDISLLGDGKIKLRDKLITSVADLTLTFNFTDKYKLKNDITKGLFGDGKFPGAFDLDPQIKRSKGTTGEYTWRAGGPLNRLQFSPAPGSALKNKQRSPAPGATEAAESTPDILRAKPAKSSAAKSARERRAATAARKEAQQAATPLQPAAPVPEPAPVPPPNPFVPTPAPEPEASPVDDTPVEEPVPAVEEPAPAEEQPAESEAPAEAPAESPESPAEEQEGESGGAPSE